MPAHTKKAMWLFIESVMPDRFRTGSLGQGTIKVEETAGRSNAMLPKIAEIFSVEDLQQLTGVCVVQGPGSFTAVRTGVLIANLLARMFHKPLVGISADETQDLNSLAASLEAGNLCSVDYIAPQYSAEPNITLKPSVQSVAK